MIILLCLVGLLIVGATLQAFGKKPKRSSLTNSQRQAAAHVKPVPVLNERRANIDNLILSDEQRCLFDLVEKSREHFFITGKAGTGKSVLLQYLQAHLSKNLVVVAPTGVAALNVGGQTIHSLFRIKPELIQQQDVTLDYKTKTLLRHVDTIMIDEVSMVRADLMDAIHYKMQLVNQNDEPFGG